MPVEMLSNSAKTKEKVRSNALDDWKNIEKWANTLLEHGTVNNVLSIEQATKEADIASVLWKRTKNAKGGDCLSDWNTFQSAFAAWKTAFCQQNAGNPPISFYSIVDADLLQRNLTKYENGDHSSARVEVLVFYFRKLAGKKFLKQTKPSQLFPEGNTWTAAELTAIKEQLDKQFFDCIQELESELVQAILKEHQQQQTHKNDVLWWLADACVQNKEFFSILNTIICCCYGIKLNDVAAMERASGALSDTYEKFNPLAGNFRKIYKENFKKWQDEVERKKSDRKRYQRKKIEKELEGKYEGEELKREIERRLAEVGLAEFSMDAPLNETEADGDSIESIIPNADLSTIERVEGVQSACCILQAGADLVISKKHLKSNNDDLFFTEIVSQIIWDNEDIAKHVRQKNRSYTEACNLDFLNFYLQKTVRNIYDSWCIPIKRIQAFHPEEQKPEYNRLCGFPLEGLVYQQFLHAKNASNITGKRDTFKKHMRDCLINRGFDEVLKKW